MRGGSSNGRTAGVTRVAKNVETHEAFRRENTVMGMVQDGKVVFVHPHGMGCDGTPIPHAQGIEDLGG